MRRNYLLSVLLCGVPFTVLAQQTSAPAAAPATPPAAQAVTQTASQTAPGQVQLDLVVTEKGGNAVAGLQRGDFTVLDNDRPVAIQSFDAYGASAAAPPVPTQIIVIIDTVNLGFQEVSYSRLGLDQFLRRDGGHLANPVSIYWYTDTGIESGIGPSSDGNELAAALDATGGRLRDLNRATAWGAIERYELSVRTLEMIAHKAAVRPGRKLLIWVGPGWPMLLNPNVDEMSWKARQSLFANIVDLSTLLREAQMQVYSVAPGIPNGYTTLYDSYLKGVKKASKANLANLDLKVIAIESGGQVQSPSNDLAAEIERCVRDAAAYYTVSFTPPPADGPNEYHEIKVRVDKPGLTARTNTGYYDQPRGTEAPLP